MSKFINELMRLIKSKYPIVFIESIDEEYIFEQIIHIARETRYVLYHWSITTGLRRFDNDGTFYQTADPNKMLQTALYLVENNCLEPSLYVLKDFGGYLEDPLTQRHMKDLIQKINRSPVTVIILAPEYKLPIEIEAFSARILGGYPDAWEIDELLRDVIKEWQRTNRLFRTELGPAQTEQIVKALKGLSVQQIRRILSQAVVDDNELSLNDVGTILDYKRKFFDQEGLLEFCVGDGGMEIAGFPNLKTWLSDRSHCFTGQVTAEGCSLPPPKGLLLMGVQGCGKSLAVKIIAKELGLPLYRLDLGRLYSSYIGQTEQNLRRALQIADNLAPLCLWIDEIEKGFAKSDGQVDGGVSQRLLGSFLTWMQEHSSTCFIAATANEIYHLPPEFLRKGRFDEVFFVDLPNPSEREMLFRIHLKKRNLNAADFDLNKLAARSEDFSGAEIEQVIIDALYRASTLNQPLNTAQILEQIENTKPLAILKGEEIAELREWAKERTVKV